MDKLAPLLKNVDEFTGLARKRLADPELAADAVQASLLKALRSSDQLRDKENANAWFYRILRERSSIFIAAVMHAARALADLEHEIDSLPGNEEERIVCKCIERLLSTMTPQYAGLIRQLDLDEESPDTVAASLVLAGTILTCGSIVRDNSLSAVSNKTAGYAQSMVASICHCGTDPKQPG